MSFSSVSNFLICVFIIFFFSFENSISYLIVDDYLMILLMFLSNTFSWFFIFCTLISTD